MPSRRSLSSEVTSPHSDAMYTNVMNQSRAYEPNAAASTIRRILRSYSKTSKTETLTSPAKDISGMHTQHIRDLYMYT